MSRNQNRNPIKNLTEKFITAAYLILGITTLLWTISFIIYHFYLNSVFGFYPSYNNPTYSEFAGNIFIVELNGFITGFMIVAFWCVFLIFPSVFVINVLLKFTAKIKLNWKIILFSFVCCLMSWLVLLVLGDTFTWLLD